MIFTALSVMAQSFSFSWKNDVLSEKDYHYSNALNLSYLFGDYSLSLNQDIFTPKDIKSDTLHEDDMPYASHLSLQGAYNLYDPRLLQRFYITVGYVGENSYGHYVQKKFHEMTNNPDPLGWPNQIDHVMTFGAGYTLAHKTSKGSWGIVDYDWVNGTNLNLGNFYSGIDLDSIFRIGHNYAQNFNIGNSFLGDRNRNLVGFYQPHRKSWGYSLSVGAALNYIAYFLPLDGDARFDVTHNSYNYRIIGAASVIVQNFEFIFSYQNSSAFIKEFSESYQWGEITFLWGW